MVDINSVNLAVQTMAKKMKDPTSDVSAALNATFLTVLVHNGTAYPARPAGAPAGLVRYVGPTSPTGALAGDEWLDTSTAPVADTTAPTAVTGLTAGTATSSTVPLSWTAATDNTAVTGYEYSTNGTTYVSTGSTGTTYTVTGLTANTAYTVQVRAFDAAGNKGTAGSVSATTGAAPPSYSSVATGLAPTTYLALGEAAGASTFADTGSASRTWAVQGGTFATGSPGIGDGALAANFAPDGRLSAAGISFSGLTSGSIAMLIKPNAAGAGLFTGSLQFYVAAGKLTASIGGTVFTGTATLAAGTRYHVGLTWNGTNVVFYVNGAVDSTTASTVAAGAAGGSDQIGIAGGAYLNGIGAGIVLKKSAAFTAPQMLSLAQAAGLA